MANLLNDECIRQFREQAPELTNYLDKVELELNPTYDPPFDYLIRSIIYQQLSGKAATTIYQRFKTLLNEITPSTIISTDKQDLRAAGLSRQKAEYVKNVAQHFMEKGKFSHLTTFDMLKDLESKEIIDIFTTIKGVGEWTVQMYLIFGLGRMNIFAAKDLGVRKGIELMYNLKETPTPGRAKKIIEHWDGLKTVGTILCWRIQD